MIVIELAGGTLMNVLLFSMPDSFEHMPPVAIRMPNGALASLAGNVDPHHRVAVADFVLVQDRVRETVERLVAELEPDVVGLSVMTFQRTTALRIIGSCARGAPSAHRRRRLRSEPGARAYTRIRWRHRLHRARRGRAHVARAAARARGATRLRPHRRASPIAARDGFRHNPARGGERPRGRRDPACRNRDARVLDGYTLLGRPVDVVETSRGCTFDCSFCSIIEMRGRNFITYPIDRVLADIRDARAHGAGRIFLVDDNITLDVGRFEALCQAIIDAGFNDTDYIVQAMTSPIAQHGERSRR